MTDFPTGLTTIASQWVKPLVSTVVARFPSGNLAEIQSMSFEAMLSLGELPDIMVSVVLELLEGKQDIFQPPKTAQALNRQLKFLDGLCEVAFIKPRVRPAAQKGEGDLTPADILYTDKIALVQFLSKPTQRLLPFPEGQEQIVDLVGAEQELQSSAEPTPSDPGVGDGDSGDERLVDGLSV